MTFLRGMAAGLALFNAALAAMATAFANRVAWGGSPITAEVYGPDVFAIPALVWIGIQLFAALTGMAGALLLAFAAGGWRRFGAFLGGIGNTVLASLFLCFAFLSAEAQLGALTHDMSAFAAFPMAAFYAVMCGRQFFWGRGT